MVLWTETFDRVPSPTFEDLQLTTSVSVADLDGDGFRPAHRNRPQLIAYRNLGNGVRTGIHPNDDPMMRVEGRMADVTGTGSSICTSIQSRHLIENRPTMGGPRFLGRGFEFEEISSVREQR